MADQIANFLTFTSSTSEEVARQYLEMAGGNLENAVGLFMEMGGENGLRGGTGVGLGVGGTGLEDANVAAMPNNDGLDPTIDAATRAAILAAQGGPQGTPIRAPDQTRTMRLVGGETPGHHPNAMLSAVAGPMMMNLDDINAMSASTWGMDVRGNINREAERRARSGTSEDDAVNVDDSDDDEDDSTTPHDNHQPAQSLSTMFSPPTHLMHRGGGFQGARNVAKDARRWLLVNVQNDSDFACHALNRDVWRDELVENLVREGFIFWQVVSGNTFVACLFGMLR
jgi:hypothetical protein